MKGRGVRAELRGRDALALGRDTIDLRGIPQIVDAGQALAAGDAIVYAVDHDLVTGEATTAEILARVFADIDAGGLRVLAPAGRARYDYALPRRQDVGAVLNRLRSYQVSGRRPDAASGEIAADTAADTAASAAADTGAEPAARPATS
jgi:hypothetical protein